MMTTSAFRIPLDQLGQVCAYPLTPEIEQVFDELARLWRRRTNNEHARAPYASLATALSAVTGQPVTILDRPRVNGDRHWLITTAPIDPVMLLVATRVWERCARGGEDANLLGPLLGSVSPRGMSMVDDVDTSAPGRVSASNWVFRVLGWNIATQLAGTPVDFDGRKVAFRLDTVGDLVAWDDPIEYRGARGLIKISLGIKTLPGIGELVCVPEISLTRLVDDFRMVKSAWIDHGRSTGGSALLRLPIVAKKVDGAWSHLFRDYSGTVVEQCGLSPIPWHEEVLTECPDTIRAWRGVNWSHRLGTGVGTRTYLRLAEHVSKMLDVELVRCSPTTIRVRSEADSAPIRGLDAAIVAAGYARLRFVHLSGWAATRERVRNELQHHRESPIPPDVGVAHPLTAHSELVSYDVAELLRHGKMDRSALLAQASLLDSDATTLVLALVDTEYESGTSIEDDAKPQVRAALAAQGIPTQFIAVAPGSDGSRKKSALDFPVHRAVWDLQRAGGLSDDRLAAAARLKRDVWLVGAHIRIQNGTARPQLVKVLLAAHAFADATRPWEFWIHVPGQGWLPHAAGLTAFHQSSIGTPVENRQAALAHLRGYVDSALDELPGEDPLIVMTSADQTRRVWSGVTDLRLGEEPLPGSSLARATDITVIRVGTADSAVPRPIDHSDGRQAADPCKPASPRSRLYELHGERGARAWMLGQSSRTFDEGSKGRVGSDYTRFTLPPGKAKAQGDNWHAFTATEFVVARRGLFDEESAVAIAARLCAQPLSWDGRTREPVPLHLARLADQDHPQYRTHHEEY